MIIVKNLVRIYIFVREIKISNSNIYLNKVEVQTIKWEVSGLRMRT